MADRASLSGITLPADPTSSTESARKGYVDLFQPLTGKGVANGYAGLDAAAQLAPSVLPEVTSVVRTITYAATVATDASVGGNLINIAATGALTISEPTNGVDRQILRYAVYCAAAQTVTLASTINLSTGLTTRAFSVPAGKVLLFAIEFVNALTTNKWVLTAATVSA